MTSMYRRTLPLLGIAVAGLLGLAACEDRGAEAESVAPGTPSSAGAATSGEAETGDEDRPDDRYSTGANPREVAVGTAAPVNLSIEAGSGLHPNREYPNWSFEFEKNSDWTITPKKVTAKDVTLGDRRAYFRVEVTPKTAGTAKLRATADFSVCNDQTCHILRDEKVAFEITAQQQGSQQ